LRRSDERRLHGTAYSGSLSQCFHADAVSWALPRCRFHALVEHHDAGVPSVRRDSPKKRHRERFVQARIVHDGELLASSLGKSFTMAIFYLTMANSWRKAWSCWHGCALRFGGRVSDSATVRQRVRRRMPDGAISSKSPGEMRKMQRYAKRGMIAGTARRGGRCRRDT